MPDIRWRVPPERPEIVEGETHVWAIDVDDAATDHAAFESLLTVDEQVRAEAFRAATDRRRFVAGRGTLRTLLGRHAGIAPQDVRIVYSAFGKPELEGDKADMPLHFNASGSGGLLLVALRLCHCVGVDVERVETIADDVARSAMTAGELEEWNSLTLSRRMERFFEIWVGKEAVSKALGEGLSLQFSDFELPPRLGSVHLPDQPGLAARPSTFWIAPLPAPQPGFAAALSSSAPLAVIRLWSAQADAWNQQTISAGARSPQPGPR